MKQAVRSISQNLIRPVSPAPPSVFEISMQFRLNRLGKIVSAGDTEGSEKLALFIGFNFMTVVDKSSRDDASRFIKQIAETSDVQSSLLRLDLGSGHRDYVCFGFATDGSDIHLKMRDAGPLNDALDRLTMIKSRMRMLFNQMPTALLLVDQDGGIDAVNPALERLFGFSGEELVQKSIGSLLSTSAVSTTIGGTAPELSSLIDGRFHRMSGIVKSGEIIPVELCLRELDDNGEQFVLCIFDVSERVALEKMKQEFVGMVSHDLRSPLSFIISSLALLNEGIVESSSEKGKKTLQQVEEEAFRLSQLVTDLLDLTRVESGRFEIHKATVPLDSLVELGLISLTNLITEHEISIVKPENNIDLSIDLERMAQVITNLVNNAIKACEVGGKIEITCTEHPQFVELVISDNGVGLSRDEQLRIFESFVTLPHGKTTSKSQSGTGLGLSICKSIVELHGGTIGVDSAPGQGTQFTIKIPSAVNL